MSRLSLIMIKLARAIMPPERHDWANAIEAEYPHIAENRASFAAGCLWSAIMANLVNITRMTQLSLGLLAILLLGLAGNTIWFTVSYLPNYGSNPLAQQLAFVLSHLSEVALALIGAGGAVLAYRAAHNRALAATICAKTISIVTLGFASIFVMIVVNALLQPAGAKSTGLALEMTTLCIAPFAIAGWAGLGGPQRLAQAGMVGFCGLGLWHVALTGIGQSDKLWEGFGVFGLVLMALIAVSGVALTRFGQFELNQ